MKRVAVTWDELATAYDKQRSGRKARTLPMDAIWRWALTVPEFVMLKGQLYWKDERRQQDES